MDEEAESDRLRQVGNLCYQDPHSRIQLQTLDHVMKKLMKEVFEDCLDYERGSRFNTNEHAEAFVPDAAYLNNPEHRLFNKNKQNLVNQSFASNPVPLYERMSKYPPTVGSIRRNRGERAKIKQFIANDNAPGTPTDRLSANSFSFSKQNLNN